MTKRTACLVVLLGALPWTAWAQVPAGPEFRVNTYTTGEQYFSDLVTSSVASDASGNFVVVWRSLGQDGSGEGVFGQRFSAAGAPLGAEFRVNTVTASDQRDPSITSDASGNLVVAWQSYGQDGSDGGVFGQRFSAAGAPLGGEFRVNTFTTSRQSFPSMASDANGNFVVAWNSLGQDGSGYGVFGQRFSVAGAPLGAEFRVNSFTTGRQFDSSIAAAASGNFVVAWSSFGQDGSGYGVFGQRFSAAGAPLGAEFQINSFTTNRQFDISIASAASGDFVVAWTGTNQAGSGDDVFAQRFNAAGTPLGAEFRVNSFTTSRQDHPSVASDASGNFVVTWTSNAQGYGIFGQRFSAAGAPLGTEFRVDSFAALKLAPSVASDPTGNFVVAWSSDGQDGSSAGVFGQRFGGLHPAVLGVDTLAKPSADGNGVLEPGEFTDARPSWSNVNGAAQAFGGVFSEIAGPSGAHYVIFDPGADYGTVADGATGACLDCYGIAVSSPTARPVLHWDASVLETIPGAHGQTKRWRLHFGDSFTDVPRTNPFYRFIETLLHKQITGGCTGTTYCPGASTLREQMAVFVLVAREAPGYAPPDCVPPNLFDDVQETSPFCRWIEELSRRGVVSGCGGGNYCPSDAVTREQMAVFVLRTLDPALNPPACVAGSELFADVPASSGFCKWIEELARRGVVTGCGGGNYCPSASVTREQMGVFISATFGLQLYGP